MKIRVGDTVQIVSGSRKYKGQTGKVLKSFPETHKVVVEGVNVVTRHMKKFGTQAGQVVKFEKAIDVSNVMLLCPITEKATRVGFVMVDEKGQQKKYRYSKRAAKEGNKAPKDCIIK